MSLPEHTPSGDELLADALKLPFDRMYWDDTVTDAGRIRDLVKQKTGEQLTMYEAMRLSMSHDALLEVDRLNYTLENMPGAGDFE